jgi:hypothetical protein
MTADPGATPAFRGAEAHPERSSSNGSIREKRYRMFMNR